MTPDALAALAGLFLAAFGAATILPFQSEIVFVGVLAADLAPDALVLAVASVGNTLGSVATWAMGRWIERFRHRRWFPLTETQLARARGWYARWGVWTLLLSWAPYGDGFTLIAGVMRTPLWLFVPLVAAVKTARYALILWAMG